MQCMSLLHTSIISHIDIHSKANNCGYLSLIIALLYSHLSILLWFGAPILFFNFPIIIFVLLQYTQDNPRVRRVHYC